MWERDLSLWTLPTFLLWKVKMVFYNLFDQIREHLQLKLELLDVNRQKINKSMKYSSIPLKFMKIWQLEFHAASFR